MVERGEIMDRSLQRMIEENIKKLEAMGKNEEASHLRAELEKNLKAGTKISSEVQMYIKNKKYENILEILKKEIQKRNFEEVINICTYWIQSEPENSFAYYFLALANNGMENYEEARAFHKKALELNSNLADIARGISKFQKNYDEREVNCIGCGDEQSFIVNVSNQSIAEDNKELVNPLRIWRVCKNCGLIYASPSPSESVLNKYYDIISTEKFGGIYGDVNTKFEFLVEMANKRLERIERLAGKKGRLIDIGTGIGSFVGVALDKGWQACGLEFNKQDCKYAKENFEIDLIQKNFYNFKEDEQYDVVTLFEVIEHLSSPLEDLKQIAKIVKEKGLLVIATPIQDSLYGKKMKEQNIFWNVVTHLSYFRKNVLIQYIETVGFDVLEIHESNEGMGRLEFYCQKK